MSRVPDYEPMLAAYHRAFAPELKAMIAALPLREGMQVLDMACGDGAYSPWLAEHVAPSGRVVAVDLLPKYLAIAREAAAKSPHSHMIEFSAGTIDDLPFANNTFDLAWCAQSLYSLPDPVEVIRNLQAVTKPGGTVAVLEADTLHHLLLPWPIEVELAVRVAELEDLAEHVATPRKFYVGRRLREVFAEAGVDRIQVRTFATDRAAPLGPDERTYLGESLLRLADRVQPRLQGATGDRFRRLVEPDSDGYLLDSPNLVATTIDHLVWGTKP